MRKILAERGKHCRSVVLKKKKNVMPLGSQRVQRDLISERQGKLFLYTVVEDGKGVRGSGR